MCNVTERLPGVVGGAAACQACNSDIEAVLVLKQISSEKLMMFTVTCCYSNFVFTVTCSYSNLFIQRPPPPRRSGPDDKMLRNTPTFCHQAQ